MSDFRDTLYTVDERGRRRWVYPSIVSGVFRQRRRVVATILLAVYALMPWTVVGQDVAIRFDLPNRRFTVLGATLHAS